MSANELEIRDHRYVRAFFGFAVLFFAVMGVVSTLVMLWPDDDRALSERIVAAALFGGFWFAWLGLGCFLFAIVCIQRWHITENALEVVRLFRRSVFSWDDISSFRIERYGDWSCYRATLVTFDGKRHKTDYVEFLKEGKRKDPPTLQDLPASARDKAELAVNHALKFEVKGLALTLLLTFLFGWLFHLILEWRR